MIKRGLPEDGLHQITLGNTTPFTANLRGSDRAIHCCGYIPPEELWSYLLMTDPGQ